MCWHYYRRKCQSQNSTDEDRSKTQHQHKLQTRKTASITFHNRQRQQRTVRTAKWPILLAHRSIILGIQIKIEAPGGCRRNLFLPHYFITSLMLICRFLSFLCSLCYCFCIYVLLFYFNIYILLWFGK